MGATFDTVEEVTEIVVSCDPKDMDTELWRSLSDRLKQYWGEAQWKEKLDNVEQPTH